MQIAQWNPGQSSIRFGKQEVRKKEGEGKIGCAASSQANYSTSPGEQKATNESIESVHPSHRQCLGSGIGFFLYKCRFKANSSTCGKVESACPQTETIQTRIRRFHKKSDHREQKNDHRSLPARRM